MIEEKISYFKRDNGKVFQRNLAAVCLAVVLLFFGGSAFIGRPLRGALQVHDYKSALIILGVMGSLCVFGLYGALSMFLESWRSAYWVELTDAKMIGYSFHKKPMWEVPFDKIEKIYAPKGYNPFFIVMSMVFVDITGAMYFVSVDVEKFGTLMEQIKGKAVNAKKVNFGSWPSNRLAWKK